MKVYNFPRGGIYFTDPYAPARSNSVLSFLPGISIIPLRGYSGICSLPVVSEGSYVEEGQLIARSQGGGSANIYSPVPGKIIQSLNWSLGGQLYCDALVIRLEGKFEELGRKKLPCDWENLSQFELRKIIYKMGIISMHGGGRPVCEIFSEYDAVQKPFDLVIKCIFDDPWLAAEYAVCKERPAAVAVGSVITARASGALSIVVAASKNDVELGRNLLSEIEKTGFPASMAVVGTKYPQSSKREMETAFNVHGKTERRLHNSLMLFCPATLAAVNDAVVLGRPILDRFVAVGGSALKKTRILKVRIGTRVEDVFKECGGFAKKPGLFVVGTPVLGKIVE
ncbi:MAG: 4Fe-4S ferredoxin, partial [Spirochaetaceae bacterium]|nr:4Fe-4S ferredoxin [Spirochaetaceae bacterium]